MSQLILVYTSSHAFAIEKRLKKASIYCKLSPIPRGVSSDCGICVWIHDEDLPTVKQLLGNPPIEVEDIVSWAENE